MTFTITAFEAKDINVGLFATHFTPAFVASVQLDNGDVVSVSQLRGEDYWALDSHFRSNGFPVFCNGEGSRVTRVKTLDPVHPLTLELDRRART